MPAIILNSEIIYDRIPKIRKMLRPLFALKHEGPACNYRPGENRALVFAAHQGSLPTNFLDWRFNVIAKNFLGSYYEIWRPIELEKLDEYYLEKAYLTIFLDSVEYISVHCDPEEPEVNNSNSHLYKRGPHLHIHRAEAPIPKSHFALAHGFLDQILASDENLFDVITQAIELIRDEVLHRI